MPTINSQHQEPRRRKTGFYLESHREHGSTWLIITPPEDLWPPELLDNKFLLFEAALCAVLCCNKETNTGPKAISLEAPDANLAGQEISQSKSWGTLMGYEGTQPEHELKPQEFRRVNSVSCSELSPFPGQPHFVGALWPCSFPQLPEKQTSKQEATLVATTTTRLQHAGKGTPAKHIIYRKFDHVLQTAVWSFVWIAFCKGNARLVKDMCDRAKGAPWHN